MRPTPKQTQAHRREGSDRIIPWGRGAVLKRTAMSWLTRWIDVTATPRSCLVAAQEIDGDTSEVLAWACREVVHDRHTGEDAVQLHYVYTIQAARGRGLATLLIETVLAEASALGIGVEATYLSKAGEALLAKAHATEEAAQ